MINRIVLVGRLTKDPELKYTANGVAIANFTLAVNRPFANQQGQREADFIQCIVWRKPAENVAQFLKKGSLAGVEGRIQTRSYDNNEGKRVWVTEVVADSVQFLEPKNSSGGYAERPRNQEPARQPVGSMPAGGGQKGPFDDIGVSIDITDDDLPF